MAPYGAHSYPLHEATLTADPPHLVKRAVLRGLARTGVALSVLALVSSACPLRAGAQEARPTMFVFVQLDIKSSVLEQALKKQLPGLALTVFGRFRDFQDGIATRTPDAILAITQLLDLNHIKPTLQGMRGTKDSELYLLVTSGSAVMTSFTGKTIGIIDLLGREGTQAFAAAALATQDVKVKRVPKIEDLLPLLEFSAADAILIPSSAFKRFTERTRLTLTVRDLPNARVGLPAVAVRNEKTRDVVVKAIQQLGAETLSLLGIDNWSTR
jgi:hypothetical protein